MKYFALISVMLSYTVCYSQKFTIKAENTNVSSDHFYLGVWNKISIMKGNDDISWNNIFLYSKSAQINKLDSNRFEFKTIGDNFRTVYPIQFYVVDRLTGNIDSVTIEVRFSPFRVLITRKDNLDKFLYLNIKSVSIAVDDYCDQAKGSSLIYSYLTIWRKDSCIFREKVNGSAEISKSVDEKIKAIVKPGDLIKVQDLVIETPRKELIMMELGTVYSAQQRIQDGRH